MSGGDNFGVLGELVHDGEDGGVSMGLGKGTNKVIGEVLPWCLGYFEGLEWGGTVLLYGFVLLAFGTALNISLYRFKEVWPVVVSLNEFLGLVHSWVACCWMVMVLLEDGLLDGAVAGY